MKLPLVFLLLLPFFISAADKNPVRWFKGSVVFHSGDTLECKLKFTRKVTEGLIQVMRDDRVEILTVKNLQSFSYFDETRNQVRTYYNLSLIPELSTRKHEIFIELLYGTKTFSLLNHKTLGYSDKTIQINPFRKKVVINKMYLFDKINGVVVPLSRENILLLMEEKKTAVLSFIETNSLKLKRVDDYISLLDYHQNLVSLK